MIVTALIVAAAVAGTATLVPVRVTSPPTIDGRLDDDAWRAVPQYDTFTQKFPNEGSAPTERTSVRVGYDDDAIYIGIECEQRQAAVVKRLTRRDRVIEADRVTIDLDTRGDGRTAFHFEVNAAGALADGIRFDDTEMSFDWDENWEAAARVDDDGWTAEVRIPLRVLRFRAAPTQQWGIQVRRYVSARQEIDEWAFIPRSTAGEVSHYGALGGR